MYNHNKAQQSKNRVQISWDILYIQPYFSILGSRQSGRHFSVGILKFISFNEKVRIAMTISLKFVPNYPIDNESALVQIMALCWVGNKPLSAPLII